MLCTEECFVMAVIYIDRISNMNSRINLNEKTIHKLFLISSVLAAKFHDDKFYLNSFYAHIGGIGLPELNFMEMEFLKCIKFNLYIDAELFNLY